MKDNNQNDRFDGMRGDEYDHLAKAYPHLNEFQGLVGKKVAQHINPHAKILEIGTGTGFTLVPMMKELHGMNCEVTALDINANDLEIAEFRAEGKIQCTAEDMFTYLPTLPTDSLDAIATGWTLHNFTSEKRAFLFKEIKRVLKPNGVFVNGDRFAYDDVQKQAVSIYEQLVLYRDYLPENLCTAWSTHILEDEKWKFTENEQLLYFPNGKFVFRKRNEGVFIAINE